MAHSLIDVVKNSISDADREKSQLDEAVLKIDGMSSDKVRHLLNNLCRHMDDTRYLEVGTWKGSTLISASYKNEGTFIGVDNFQYFGGPKEAFYKNRELFSEHSQVSFFEESCWDLDLNNIPKINVYLYDGKHSQIEQYRAYTHFDSILEDHFITIVDDWNVPHVRTGTFDAFRDLGYKVEYQWERLTEKVGDKQDYWNGMTVFVGKK
jgi:hypothetical protein